MSMQMARERILSTMGCERSVIIIILLLNGYLVYSLGNRAMTLSTKTGLTGSTALPKINAGASSANDRWVRRSSGSLLLTQVDDELATVQQRDKITSKKGRGNTEVHVTLPCRSLFLACCSGLRGESSNSEAGSWGHAWLGLGLRWNQSIDLSACQKRCR